MAAIFGNRRILVTPHILIGRGLVTRHGDQHKEVSLMPVTRRFIVITFLLFSRVNPVNLGLTPENPDLTTKRSVSASGAPRPVQQPRGEA